MTKAVQKTQFRSGIAAKLSGVPVETLRVWERRYAITTKPTERGEHRFYSQSDIERLSLLKRLVDLGQSIGTIAQLDLASLQRVQRSLMSLSTQAPNPTAFRPSRIALVGSVLGSPTVKTALESHGLQVMVQLNSATHMKSLDSDIELDACLVEVPTLLDKSAQELLELSDSLGFKRLVLFYRFAPNALIRKLRLLGHAVVRMPFDPEELVLLCGALMNVQSESQALGFDRNEIEQSPAPRFSTETLMRLSQVKSGVYCECPSQLAELLISVTAFERYSAQCASQTAEDATLHRRLESDAAQIRGILEASITEVIRHEKILI